MKIAGIQLGSEDSKKLAEFYEKAFGKPSFMEGEWYGFDVSGVGIMVGPHSEVKGQNDCPGRIMVMFTTKEVEKEFERFKECGAKEIAKPYQPNEKENPEIHLATVADPDGNYIQITTPWED